MASFMLAMWHPLIDMLFAPRPLPHRWRLLLFLPITLLSYTVRSLPYLFSRPFETCYIPTRCQDQRLRALVYNHPNRCSKLQKKRPLHIDVHAGGFIGGLPEDSVPLCAQIAEKTGAVVVSLTYRFAPRYPFPAAHDDVADALAWLVNHAEERFGADVDLVTVSGISAGGNIALGATLGAKDSTGFNLIKGAVTFYSPMDLRLPPWEKRKPHGFPSFDPMRFMLPLFDAYAGPERVRDIHDARLHPTLASLHDLPYNMLFIVPTIDFLIYEQLEMVERLQKEAAEQDEKKMSDHHKRKIEKVIFEGQWHGWLELPSWAIDESTRRKAFTTTCNFITSVHQKHGFDVDQCGVEINA
ncbi:MAG: hypothetical protein LQ339_005403 [Xanthoria mediterranea]|nr:MAG: hypothetical protein LQ339_005403 [Xanthoria mediterranea]